MGCFEFVHMRQILQGSAVRREDLVIACDGRRRAEEELGARRVPTAGIFSRHIVLDKLEQRAYAMKIFKKNVDDAQRAFRRMFPLLGVKI